MKTKNKLLLIVIIITIFGCHNVYAQTDSIYIFSRGKLVERHLIDNTQQFFLRGGPLYPSDTLFIHLPPKYQKVVPSDSIKFTFKDVGGQPIKSEYAYIDKDGVVYLTDVDYKKIFVLKRKDGKVIHYYAVLLYFGNSSSKYIVLVATK